MSYTAFLVIGVLAEYLGTGRFVAGLLLGVLFARFPRISNGKVRIVGLLPKPARRPLIFTLLGLCLVHFLAHSDHVAAGFTGFAIAFLLAFPWLRRALFDRILRSFGRFTGKKPADSADDLVIDGEFRERKE
ncbi:hypothetical protein [Pseudoduganella buxea]|nr:hypothetical protein [Pseudoduganella buxea]